MQTTAKLPRGFHLVAWGTVASTSEPQAQFIQLFWAAWNSIPLDAREAILSLSEGENLTVDFCDDKSDLRCGPSGSAVAQCSEGRIYTFVAPIFTRLPRQDAITLIGHELAHGYLFAKGKNHGRNAYEKDEEDVRNLLVNEWKFSGTSQESLNAALYLIQKGIRLRP